MAQSRAGLSLAELMVAVFLASLVGGVITTTLVRQQHFYRGAAELHYVREGTRDAIEVLSTDIRGLSVDDTVRVLADSAIELFANIGSSVACQVLGSDVGLPSIHSSGSTLSAFLVTPDSGDLALFLLASDSGKVEWEQHRVSSFTASVQSRSCPASAFTDQGQVAASGFIVTLSAPPSSSVKPGSSVRFERRGRYSLYRASDGESYLGYRRCSAVGPPVCGAIQPVSGPYRRYSANRLVSGLVFDYFDATGQPLGPGSSASALARVDITARSESGEQAWLGDGPRRIGDSATAVIAIRNADR